MSAISVSFFDSIDEIVEGHQDPFVKPIAVLCRVQELSMMPDEVYSSCNGGGPDLTKYLI
jgi:hypothetical protein